MVSDHHFEEPELRGAYEPAIVVWAARLSIYFLAQGALTLLSYAYYGFDTNPAMMPLGFRLDPLHASLRFAWGLAGTYIGFFQIRWATAYLFAFAAFYTALAALGTFTPYHFGMRLSHYVNLFHWIIVVPIWAVALYGVWWQRRYAHLRQKPASPPPLR